MWGLERIELPTSCTQSKHHTPRPKSLKPIYLSFFFNFIFMHNVSYIYSDDAPEPAPAPPLPPRPLPRPLLSPRRHSLAP